MKSVLCDWRGCKDAFHNHRVVIHGLEKIKPSKMKPLWAATGGGTLVFCGLPCLAKWLRKTKIYLK